MSTTDMNRQLLDLLTWRCQVKFTQSSRVLGGDGASTKCWVHLEGYGPLIDSGWQESPEAALNVAWKSLGERLGFQPTYGRTQGYNGQEHR